MNFSMKNYVPYFIIQDTALPLISVHNLLYKRKDDYR